jgi:hypothetical protein
MYIVHMVLTQHYIIDATSTQKDKLLQHPRHSLRRLLALPVRNSTPIQFRKDIDNKRSKLFPDRKRIPGRKTKFILACVYLVHIYAVSKFLHQKRVYS